MNGRRILLYLPAYAKGYIRNPLGLFFALVFPVILILIFGAVFSNAGNSQAPLYVQNLDHSSPVSMSFLAALNQSGAVSITMVSPDAGNLSTYLAQNGYNDGLVIPTGFGADVVNHTPVYVTVYTNPSAGSSAGLVLGAVEGVSNGFNLHLAGGTQVISTQSLQVGSQSYTYIDYLIPGLIGFSVLISPMFSMVNITSTWKKDKLFRQLSLTPLTRGEWLAAALIWYVLLAVISALLLVSIGQWVFGAHVSFTWLMLPFLVLGPALFVSLGVLAGSVSSTPESAAVLGNIITFPMMFLAGTFFPVSQFPPWLQTVAHFLPLYYVIAGLNAAILYANASMALFDALIVLVLAVVFFVLATRIFRWRED